MSFGERLVRIYDLIYEDKDYEGECNFVEEILQRFSPHPVETILDGGCGTGNHVIPLAERGYRVNGVDSSETRIKRAREKTAKSNLPCDFQVADLRDFNLNRKFDACICMFAVMDYIIKTKDFIKALHNIREHLKKNSLFIFDFWNGLAVLRVLPSVRVKVVQDKEMRVIRLAEPELDTFNHLCHVRYRFIVSQDSTLVDEILETHTVRYYFPQEIAHYLEETGFEVLRICPFLDLNGKVDENVWNATVIAKVA